MNGPRTLAAALDAVRDAVRSGAADLPAGALAGLPPLADAPTLSRDADGVVVLVTIDVVDPVPVADLEATYGAAARLPGRPAGGRRTVQFPATIPADGETGATLLAEVDERDRAVRVMVRRDEL